MAVVDEVVVAERLGRHGNVGIAQRLGGTLEKGVETLLQRPDIAVAGSGTSRSGPRLRACRD
jgi:hypothetical protein